MAEETGHGAVVEHGAAAGQGGEVLGAEVLGDAEVAMPQLDTALYPNHHCWLVIPQVLSRIPI